MSEDAKGEVVEIEHNQYAANGERMYSGVHRWYGLDNATANSVSVDVVEGLIANAKSWDAKKQAGKS